MAHTPTNFLTSTEASPTTDFDGAADTMITHKSNHKSASAAKSRSAPNSRALSHLRSYRLYSLFGTVARDAILFLDDIGDNALTKFDMFFPSSTIDVPLALYRIAQDVTNETVKDTRRRVSAAKEVASDIPANVKHRVYVGTLTRAERMAKVGEGYADNLADLARERDLIITSETEDRLSGFWSVFVDELERERRYCCVVYDSRSDADAGAGVLTPRGYFKAAVRALMNISIGRENV